MERWNDLIKEGGHLVYNAIVDERVSFYEDKNQEDGTHYAGIHQRYLKPESQTREEWRI